MDRADRRAATVRKASRIACSLASSRANVNEFLWTNSYGLSCGEPHAPFLLEIIVKEGYDLSRYAS